MRNAPAYVVYKSDWDPTIGRSGSHTRISLNKLRKPFHWIMLAFGLMVLNSLLSLFLLLHIRIVLGRDLLALTDTELRDLLRNGGQKCDGCSRERLIQLASGLPENSVTRRQEKDSETTSGTVGEVAFDEIQNILDELREKIDHEKKEQSGSAVPPDPEELEARKKEVQEVFLNAFRDASLAKAGDSDAATKHGEGMPLEELSKDDPRLKMPKVMSGNQRGDGKIRKSKKAKEEPLKSRDYLEIAKVLGKKYSAMFLVNLEHYSRVGAALCKDYGYLSMSYANRFAKSLFYYTKIYGGMSIEQGKKFTKYAYRKTKNAGSQLWGKLTAKR